MIDRLAGPAERILFALLWLLVAIAIAFGVAGLLAALDHRPATPARPELTWAGDSVAAPTLAAARDEVAAIAALVEELGGQGRGALAALTAREWDVLEATAGRGGGIIVEIRERSDGVRERLDQVRGIGPAAAFVLSGATQERHATLVEALAATDGLALAWARVTAGSISAGRLATLLGAHDERITDAIDAGRAGDFDTALASIDEATAFLDEAQRLRIQLANQIDVTTLDEWLRRNRDYGVALRALYVASAASPDRITPEIRAALDAEEEARAALPRTTNGLTIVMGDIAQGGLNQAVIAIESARGRLAAALAALAPASGEESVDPSPSPAGSG